jgi:hypothetical protein
MLLLSGKKPYEKAKDFFHVVANSINSHIVFTVM